MMDVYVQHLVWRPQIDVQVIVKAELYLAHVLTLLSLIQKQQGVVTRVGTTHSAMGGYTRGRRWRVEERHRFITAQLYPTSDDGGNYREQFQQVP